MCCNKYSKYDKKFVFFIDILGFKNLVETSNNPIEIKQKIDLLKDDFKEQNKKHSLKYEITQVSDCIIISFSINDKFKLYPMLLIISYVQANAFIKHRLLFRGAGTYGDIIHDKDYLFGKGYQKALNFESNFAEFPRIIIDKESFQDLKSQDEKASCLDLLKEDGDFYYIDFINNELYCDDSLNDKINFLNQCGKIIKENLQHEKNILKKYNWLKKNYNISITEFNNINKTKLKKNLRKL